jgi:hypothetical protein
MKKKSSPAPVQPAVTDDRSMAARYAADIAALREPRVSENTFWFHVDCGDAKLQVEKVSVMQEKMQVRVNWAAIGASSTDVAIAMADDLRSLAALGVKIRQDFGI